MSSMQTNLRPLLAQLETIVDNVLKADHIYRNSGTKFDIANREAYDNPDNRGLRREAELLRRLSDDDHRRYMDLRRQANRLLDRIEPMVEHLPVLNRKYLYLWQKLNNNIKPSLEEQIRRDKEHESGMRLYGELSRSKPYDIPPEIRANISSYAHEIDEPKAHSKGQYRTVDDLHKQIEKLNPPPLPSKKGGKTNKKGGKKRNTRKYKK